MKIEKLRFRNLNSLYGEWNIDFTDSSYQTDGIFAITGPTGAGKSTILDAVCLALYGRTPRLPSVTKSENEIMSRNTGECYSEVTFRTPEGVFISYWSQHRARKKPGGNLADAKHELSDAETGTILETGKRDTLQAVIRKTGMDFDRFTRSMLLAQGSFASFLQASPAERAPVLEQITGTEIYTEISKRVHERRREMHQQLENLEQQSSMIAVLSAEEEQQLRADMQQLQDRNDHEQRKKQYADLQLHHFKNIDRLTEELQRVREEQKQLQRDEAAFSEEHDKLDRAERAAEIEHVYGKLQEKKQEQLNDQKRAAEHQQRLPVIKQEKLNLEAELNAAERKLKDQKKKRAETAGIITQVRALDMQIRNRLQQIQELEKTHQTAEKNSRNTEKELSGLKQQTEAAEKRKIEAEHYAETNKKDEKLKEDLAAILYTVKTAGEYRAKAAEAQEKEQQLKKQLETAKAACERKSLEQQKVQTRLEQAEQQAETAVNSLKTLLAGRTFREYEADLEYLRKETELRKIIADLDEKRKYLEEGKPCPLCGSLEHPFAKGNVPQLQKTEKQYEQLKKFIGEARELEETAAEYREAAVKIQSELSAAQSELGAAEAEKRTAEIQLRNAAEHRENAAETAEVKEQQAENLLKPYGDGKLSPRDPLLSSLLQERKRAWTENEEKLQHAVSELAECRTAVRHKQDFLEKYTHEAESAAEQVHAARTSLKEMEQKRSELFGNADPDAAEQRLTAETEKAEDALERAQEQFQRKKNEYQRLCDRLDDLQQSMEMRQSVLDDLEKSWSSRLVRQDFADTEDYVSAVMPKEARNELKRKKQELADRNIRLESAASDRKKELDTAEKNQEEDMASIRKDTDGTVLKNPEEAERWSRQLEQSLNELAKNIGGMNERLKRHDEDRKRQQSIAEEIERYKRDCQRWDRLHELIGSSDGKKYRNFVQGITFEMLTAHANRQLMQLTDRYLLVRDAEEPLELNVIDTYQAGVTRSTKNLSGGESFLVSLALALGLSHMSSRKVPVDSLFLDEGFGSLDEETLETALEALAALHQHGKIIGMISHVQALKERIPVQIEIIPETGGRSRISGPGCYRVIKENG